MYKIYWNQLIINLLLLFTHLQVLKIHQDLSELFTEEFMKKAIEQCAEEEGLKLMREITSRTFSGDKFYNNKYVIQLNCILFLVSVYIVIKINLYLF